ncbi:hypothetical protein HHK36_006261 [Tetracentron sinense]|uniref:Core-2/I-branching beta-1,6-N-acetylglucosaminyltransferase family protein n=1 Tax=Tetracentron sinense TaxID=13715 RepID=A0A834ZP71_TETSI|nr:hypothetical protein HHK36_006261 [Tetracentron sinense]
MLSPTPFSLCCALLLCLPLAVIFTTTTTTTSSTNENPSRRSVSTTNNNQTTLPPPPPLPENDDLLFRLAARVNPKPSPSGSPKKLAFMFMTTAPLPLAPFWELYFFQNQTQNKTKLFNIYIHADPSSHYDPPFSGVFSGRVIPSKPTQRFTPSLISAARRLLAHALLHDPSNAMFALLSSTCIPLHSFNFTYTTLIRSKKSFIEILKNEPGTYGRYVARGPDAMLPEVPLQSFRIGSQFFVLTRRHARLVVKDQRLWSKFKLPCVRWDTCYPEENYFPTLLTMQDPSGCVPATLTHVDWNGRSDGHPRTYQAFEVGPELIHSLRRDTPRYGDDRTGNESDTFLLKRQYPFLFARKFSPESLLPLMDIANDVIFRD